MAKLIPLLILADKQVLIGEEMVTLKAGSVHDLEPGQAKALLKEGAADDSAINIAYHTGDMVRYEELLKQAATGGKKAKKSADIEAKEKAQADADALNDQADQEPDEAKAEELRAQAADILKQAGITE